jgi:predicted nucleotidyltransferase
MFAKPADDPVLVRFRKALDEVYGSRIDRVILFGLRARGDAHPEADYDVAIFLQEPGELWDELGKLSHITGAVISAKPFKAGAYRERSPLMNEIRDDGLDL